MATLQPPPLNEHARYQVLHRLAGQIIIHWAEAEWFLFLMFGILARCDFNRARIILAAHQSFRAKRELIVRLGEAYLPMEALNDFDALMAQVKQLSEKRNMIAHHRAYYLEKERRWRFMNDSDETQPNTFGRYQDVQTGNLRTWVRETQQLGIDLQGFFISPGYRQLREQPRLFGELEADRATWASLHRIPDAEPEPQPEP